MMIERTQTGESDNISARAHMVTFHETMLSITYQLFKEYIIEIFVDKAVDICTTTPKTAYV